MRVSTGNVVVEGLPLEGGATVTSLAPEDAEAFELGPAEGAALLAGIAEAGRGEFVGGAEVLAKLSPRG